MDASDKTPGYKFADAEMRGIPLRLEIGPKDIEKGQCVLAKRLDGTKETYALNEELPNTIHQLLDQIHDEMYAKALKFRDENIRTAKTYDEFKEILNTKAGYIRMMWCEDDACEAKIKEETGATSRCIKEDEEPFGDVCPICGKPAKKKLFTLQKLINLYKGVIVKIALFYFIKLFIEKIYISVYNGLIRII